MSGCAYIAEIVFSPSAPGRFSSGCASAAGARIPDYGGARDPLAENRLQAGREALSEPAEQGCNTSSSEAASPLAENTGDTGERADISAGERTYRCQRWPFLAIGDLVKFSRGLFVATSEKQIEVIEGSSDFGVAVFRVEP